MSSASLNRFTVPLTNQSPQGLLMPKLKYRFRVTLTNFGVGNDIPVTELTKQVMSVGRPELSFEEIKLPVYNSTVKIAGKHTWSDTKLTLRDDSSNHVTQLVGRQIQKQFDFLEQSSAASGIDYKFTMSVEMLDGGNGANTPTTLERFDFLGCYIKSVVYQGGDYSSNDPMDIALTITYDNALQFNSETGSNEFGIGEAVGRTLGSMAIGG